MSWKLWKKKHKGHKNKNWLHFVFASYIFDLFSFLGEISLMHVLCEVNLKHHKILNQARCKSSNKFNKTSKHVWKILNHCTESKSLQLLSNDVELKGNSFNYSTRCKSTGARDPSTTQKCLQIHYQAARWT